MDHERFKKGEAIGDLGTKLVTIGISAVGIAIFIAGISHWNKLQAKRKSTRPTRAESTWPSVLMWSGLLIAVMPWIADFVFDWW